MKKITIGEIQDLYDWLNFNVKEGFMDEDIALDLVDSQNWTEVKRLQNMADYMEYLQEDEYIRNEYGSEESDFVGGEK